MKMFRFLIALLAAALVSGCEYRLRDSVNAHWSVENRSQHTLVFRYNFKSGNFSHSTEPGTSPYQIAFGYAFPSKPSQSYLGFEDMLSLTGQSDIPAGERFFQVLIEGQTVPLKTWYYDRPDGHRYFYDEHEWEYEFFRLANVSNSFVQSWKFIITEDDVQRWLNDIEQ